MKKILLLLLFIQIFYNFGLGVTRYDTILNPFTDNLQKVVNVDSISNPFDQDLNTTDDVQFNNIDATGSIQLDAGNTYKISTNVTLSTNSLSMAGSIIAGSGGRLGKLTIADNDITAVNIGLDGEINLLPNGGDINLTTVLGADVNINPDGNTNITTGNLVVTNNVEAVTFTANPLSLPVIVKGNTIEFNRDANYSYIDQIGSSGRLGFRNSSSTKTCEIWNAGNIYFSSTLGTTSSTSGHQTLYFDTTDFEVKRFTSGAFYKENYNREYEDYEGIYGVDICLFDEKKTGGEKNVIGIVADSLFDNLDSLICWTKTLQEEEVEIRDNENKLIKQKITKKDERIDVGALIFVKNGTNGESYYKDGNVVYKVDSDNIQYRVESYDRDGFIPILIKTVQSQKAKLDELEQRLEFLEQ